MRAQTASYVGEVQSHRGLTLLRQGASALQSMRVGRQTFLIKRNKRKKREKGKGRALEATKRQSKNGGLSSFCWRKGESQCARRGEVGAERGMLPNCFLTARKQFHGGGRRRYLTVPEPSRRRKANQGSAEQLKALVFYSKNSLIQTGCKRNWCIHNTVAY